MAGWVAPDDPPLAGADSFDLLPQERIAFAVAGTAGEIVLPAHRARIVGRVPLGGQRARLLAFAADTSTARRDLFAVVTADAAGLRLAALDLLSWREDDGAHLETRVSASDGRHLALLREAAAPSAPMRWRRERWTDYLAWRAGAALGDAAPRAPAPGSWQMRLAGWRLAVVADLADGCRDAVATLTRCGPPPAVWEP